MLVYDIRVWDGARGWRILGVGLRFGMKLEDGESIKLEDLLGLFHNSQAAYNGVNHRTCNNGWVCHRIILFNCLIFKLCSQNENSFDRQIRDLNSLFWLTQHVQQFCHSISLSYSKTFFLLIAVSFFVFLDVIWVYNNQTIFWEVPNELQWCLFYSMSPLLDKQI